LIVEEGMDRMNLRSALGRLAVTVPFFGTAAAVLTMFGQPMPVPPGADSALILIVTNETLNPAFEELESWNRSQGCRSELLILDPGPTNEQEFVQELGVFCRERGVTGVLLGGNRRQIPLMSDSVPGPDAGGIHHVVPIPTPRVSPMPPDLALGRIPVRNLDEAWAFVAACRESGETLDQIFADTMNQDMAVALHASTPKRELIPAAIKSSGRSPRP
jgi:hypothetical protein